MTVDITAVVIAFFTLLGGGGLIGWAAWRKAGKEADKFGAEAANVLVGGAKEVVLLLRDELDNQAEHQAEADRRIEALEAAVTAWDDWADKVLGIIDRAMLMLTEDQRDGLHPEVEAARRSRPTRKH